MPRLGGPIEASHLSNLVSYFKEHQWILGIVMLAAKILAIFLSNVMPMTFQSKKLATAFKMAQISLIFFLLTMEVKRQLRWGIA